MGDAGWQSAVLIGDGGFAALKDAALEGLFGFLLAFRTGT